MDVKKTTFALFFGTRANFPGNLMASARTEMQEALTTLGHKYIILDEGATSFGAVETVREGEIYANFLRQNRGKYGGVILCLPNFGDETGAIAALKHCDVPILIQAYPDDLDKMAPATRRDAFCGKFSVMDVFVQNGLPFTILPPHTVRPASDDFTKQLDYFDRLCRVVGGMKDAVVGAIGARTTAFKTVRIDELALQRHNITMETLDLSEVFHRMEKLAANDLALQAKKERLRSYCDWGRVPGLAFDKIARLGVVLDQVVDEYRMNALGIRCWLEMQAQLGISPCVLLSEMNDRGIPTACEVDMGNAVTMLALRLASGENVTCLDWNNNYGHEENKCILFHCGPVPASMMTGPGTIADHAILANTVGKGCAFGCNVGRIAPQNFTFGSMLTEAGQLKFYLGEGKFTDDPIPADFFGCAGVAEIASLQDVLMKIGYAGHRHHVSVTPGLGIIAPMAEAFEKYLDYDVLKV